MFQGLGGNVVVQRDAGERGCKGLGQLGLKNSHSCSART